MNIEKGNSIPQKAEKPKPALVSVLDTSLYRVVEKMPIFAGCENEERPHFCSDNRFLEYVFRHIRYNPIAKEQGATGTIAFSFIVEKDGAISSVSMLKGEGVSNIKEVIEHMPKWIPGEQNGVKRRVQLTFPLKIQLE